ncbi:MAG TPA: hypothetical protein VK194_01530 [Candidatus Deferrimicrobium sp.]|nr:hypothetical protein [Candidatus Deferrimicrobium sp.]
MIGGPPAGVPLNVHSTTARSPTRSVLTARDGLRIYPVIVGDGLRLFPERGQTHNLELLDSWSTSTGVMIQTYRPKGRASLGRADE